MKKHFFFLVQRRLFFAFVDILDAGEQLFVQADIVAMLSKLRHNPFGNGLHFIAGFCAKQISKYGCNPV